MFYMIYMYIICNSNIFIRIKFYLMFLKKFDLVFIVYNGCCQRLFGKKKVNEFQNINGCLVVVENCSLLRVYGQSVYKQMVVLWKFQYLIINRFKEVMKNIFVL